MADIQEELNLTIGTKEATTLEPATVQISTIKVEEVGPKKSKKLVCAVIHPKSETTINISSVKYENKGKLEVAGLWINRDSDNKIKKGSALATFMQSLGAQQVGQLIGKSVATIQDDKGYLVFKAY